MKNSEPTIRRRNYKIKTFNQENIISENGDSIEEILHDLLISKNLTISTAESCTGGELSHLITSVSGKF